VSTLRFPMRDRVAVVGVGTTSYSRSAPAYSRLSLAAEAGRLAIEDSGLDRSEIDGISGTLVPVWDVQSSLAIPVSRWWCNTHLPASFPFLEAANAVASGACETALAYHSTMVTPRMSRAAAQDPFRVRALEVVPAAAPSFDRLGHVLGYGYAAWARRYLETYGATRETFGMIAVNAWSRARTNPQAISSGSLSMADYLQAPFTRSPLSRFDMEYPVDGAEAFVLTTPERARDCRNRAVLLHAYSYGQGARPEDDQLEDLNSDGPSIAAASLWDRSDLGRADVDVMCLYDGFSIITVRWLEALGICGEGEAESFLRANWDDSTDSVMVGGSVALNPNGGSLAEGGSQGAGHIREAVRQIRGDSPCATARPGPADTALVAVGGMFFNATAMILRGAS
jgi:acetyl-CoA acetyltransferase